MSRYRQRSYYTDPVPLSLDRNDRARIMKLAEGLERKSKLPGRRNGVFGQCGLAVLRTLLMHFASARGCWPSYQTLRRKLGFSLATIRKAIRSLAQAGILTVQRRIKRTWITTADGRSYVGTVQDSNSYSFQAPDRIPLTPYLSLPLSNARDFPAKKPDSTARGILDLFSNQISLSSKEGSNGGFQGE